MSCSGKASDAIITNYEKSAPGVISKTLSANAIKKMVINSQELCNSNYNRESDDDDGFENFYGDKAVSPVLNKFHDILCKTKHSESYIKASTIIDALLSHIGSEFISTLMEFLKTYEHIDDAKYLTLRKKPNNEYSDWEIDEWFLTIINKDRIPIKNLWLYKKIGIYGSFRWKFSIEDI